VRGVKKGRRERTPRAQDRRIGAEEAPERRSPAFYATRRDVGWLVALITLLDTIAKIAFAVSGHG